METKIHISPKQLKIIEIKKLKDTCLQDAAFNLKKHTKLKRQDDAFEIITGLLSSSSIAMLVASTGFPILVIASGICSGLNMVLTGLRKSVRLVYKIERYDTTSKQYSEMARHITSVLLKNHMSSDDYGKFLQEIFLQISLIQDSAI